VTRNFGQFSAESGDISYMHEEMFSSNFELSASFHSGLAGLKGMDGWMDGWPYKKGCIIICCEVDCFHT